MQLLIDIPVVLAPSPRTNFPEPSSDTDYFKLCVHLELTGMKYLPKHFLAMGMLLCMDCTLFKPLDLIRGMHLLSLKPPLVWETTCVRSVPANE